jgi:hypothetical protein
MQFGHFALSSSCRRALRGWDLRGWDLRDGLGQLRKVAVGERCVGEFAMRSPGPLAEVKMDIASRFLENGCAEVN